MEKIHSFDPGKPEEDFLVLLPAGACFLLAAAFPFASEIWSLARFDSLVDDGRRKRIMAFYRSCLQRHLYVHGTGKRVLSKNPSFSGAIESLHQAFPDARFVFCTRDARKTVPSQLSAISPAATLFGVDPRHPLFVGPMLDTLEHYYGKIAEAVREDFAAPTVEVAMEEMCRDLAKTVERIYRAGGEETTPEFRAMLEAEGESSRRFHSSHRYSLADFGLSEADIETRFPRRRTASVRRPVAADAHWTPADVHPSPGSPPGCNGKAGVCHVSL
jgi:hypothetical protein